MPAEIWGSDPLRRELAAFIPKKSEEAFCWPNDHFLPEDSFWVMLFPPEDDLCGVEAMMDIEDYVGISISEADAEDLRDDLRRGGRFSANRQQTPHSNCWSRSPGEALVSERGHILESQGIRDRNSGDRPPQGAATSTVATFFHEPQTVNLANYVAARFKVRPVLKQRLFGFLPFFWTWLALFALPAQALRLFASPFFWWDILIAPMPLAILLGRLARKTMPWRLTTVSDLVNWILSQRRSRAARRIVSS